MYKSDYIPLVEGDKRISLNRLVAAYRYSSGGVHNIGNAAKIDVYGVDSSGETLIGSYHLKTSINYIGGNFASLESKLFDYDKDYDYIRLQLVDETFDFLGLESDLHGIITVSDLRFDDKNTVVDPNSSGISITIELPIVGEVIGNYVP